MLHMRRYTRISLFERENIYILKQAGHNQTYIANKLGRDKATISRELRRFISDPLGYLPDRANDIAGRLAWRNLHLFRNARLRSYVIDRLKEGWSPEQISGRLKCERSDMQVSHETIYKYIYSEEGRQNKLFYLLTRKKPQRTRKHGRKPRQSHIPETAAISNRPAAIDKRKKIGHWEGDLVIFKSVQSANVSTLVERKSRLVKLVYNRGKYTDQVVGGIKNVMSALPETHRTTITLDRGTEFASYKNLGIKTYFCDPHSPWQKGSNENFNGRLRRYLPKGRIPQNLSQELLDKIEEKMNNLPRKCLGFKTPYEVFHNRKTLTVAIDP
jgi:transposase, IS30 family